LPEEIHAVTKNAAKLNAGLGLMGVAKDVYPRDGDTYSFVAGFAEVEVDVETGVVRLVAFHSVGDVGTIVNPRSLIAQINGGCCLGIAHALFQKIVYDPHYGLSLARRFYSNKPMTILDIPAMTSSALDMADPETPVGARGVGEPPVGAGFGAVLNAIADAIGVDAFRRAPVTSDVALMSLTHGKRMHEPLQSHL
jgi:xanthine dehydrogenase molybdenum-binding subunit